MENRSIDYVNPTSRALGRMTTILFRPFDLGKWFALGFSAWLAGLLDGNGPSGGGVGSPSGDISGADGDTREIADSAREEFLQYFETAKRFVSGNLEWILPLAIVLFLVVAAVVLALVWVSSRGKFMFLDNVVHNRALVVEPWKRFRAQGNSLFWWRLVFSIAALAIVAGILGGAGWHLFTSFDWESGRPDGQWILLLVGAILLTTGVILAMVYVLLLLEDFVAPVMYKHSLTAGEGWRRVLALHGARFWPFPLYALWKLLLGAAAGVMIVTLILVTCCLAGLLMIIPYVGAVLLLPVSVFFRSLGPEFLRQFGPEYDLWEEDRVVLPGLPC